MKLTQEQLLEILDWSEEFETVQRVIRSTKHSAVWVQLILKDKEGRFWELEFEQDYNDGVQDHSPYECKEMEEVLKVSYRPKVDLGF